MLASQRLVFKWSLLPLIAVLAAVTAGCTVSTFDQGDSGQGDAISFYTDYNAPLRDFKTTYLKNAANGHYDGQTFPAPSLWLFSHDGKLVALATNDKELKTISRNFPPSATAPALPDQPDFSTLMKVYTDTTGKTAPSIRADKWNGVLFFTDAPHCEQCVRLVRGLKDLEEKHGAQLSDTRILLSH